MSGHSGHRRKPHAQAKREALLIPASSHPPKMGALGALTHFLANAIISTAQHRIWLQGQKR